jgi:hypothetical protein
MDQYNGKCHRMSPSRSLPAQHRDTTTTDATDMMIYKSIQQWLTIIDRNNRHFTQHHLIVGLIMGLTPILYDEASRMRHCRGVTTCNDTIVMDTPHTDPWSKITTTILPYGIELCRLALSSFLTVLNGESGYDEILSRTHYRYPNDATDPTLNTHVHTPTTPRHHHNNIPMRRMMTMRISGVVQLQTLISLSNVLILAYPMIFRHAGKILCTLIAYIRRLDETMIIPTFQSPEIPISLSSLSSSSSSSSPINESDDCKIISQLQTSIREQAMNAAAIAHIVGETAATTVLNKVVDSDHYDSGVTGIVYEIRRRAISLTNN